MPESSPVGGVGWQQGAVNAFQLGFQAGTADPSTTTGGTQIYCKQVAGVSQLFSINAAGTVTQLTPSSGGSVTWANDLSGSTSSNQWVANISGNGGGGGAVVIQGSSATSLQWAPAQANPLITQQNPITDVAPTPFTIQAAGAILSAATNRVGADLQLLPGNGATTNGTPGKVRVALQAFSGTGTQQNFQITQSGTRVLELGGYNSGTTLGGVWCGPAAPTNANVALLGDGSTQTIVSAPSGGNGYLQMTASTTIAQWSNAGFCVGSGTPPMGGGSGNVFALVSVTTPPTSAPAGGLAMWANSGSPGSLGIYATGIQAHRLVSGFKLSQDAPTTDVATTNLTIQAQSALAGATVNRAGGSINVTSGTGATTNGSSGSIVHTIPAPTGTGTYGQLSLSSGASQSFVVGAYNNGVSYAGLWLGSGAVANTNPAILGNGSTLVQVNIPSSGGTGYLGVDGSTGILAWTSAGIQIGQTTGFGGGSGVLGLSNATTIPTSNPSGGGVAYEASGTLTHRGPGGCVEQFAAAGQGTVNTQLLHHYRVCATLHTTNSTAATIYTYTLPASGNHTVTLETVLQTTNTATLANSGTDRLEGNFSTNATTATRIGTDAHLYQSNVTQTSLSYSPTGNTVNIQVQGPTAAADHTIWVDIYEN